MYIWKIEMPRRNIKEEKGARVKFSGVWNVNNQEGWCSMATALRRNLLVQIIIVEMQGTECKLSRRFWNSGASLHLNQARRVFYLEFQHLLICSLQHLSSCLMGSFLSQILAPHLLISLLTLWYLRTDDFKFLSRFCYFLSERTGSET